MQTDRKYYKCSKQVLAWSFRKSRDGWKARALGLQSEKKVLTVRVSDVSKSREAWRSKCEEAQRKFKELEAQHIELERKLAEAEQWARVLSDRLLQRQSETQAALSSITPPVAKKKLTQPRLLK